MVLHVLGSSSKGNCYILSNEKESLIIEAGIKPSDVKEALNFDFSKVSGLLMTHEHGDHAKYMGLLMSYGIDIYASSGTHNALVGYGWNRRPIIEANELYEIGGFKVKPFNVSHDVSEPLGFIIEHEDFGKLLFCTDSKTLPYKFSGLDHILIEANYAFDLIPKHAIRDRVFQNHMEIGTTIHFLKNNDLTNVKNIVLLHLSDSNSNEVVFKQRVENIYTGNVFVAKKGLEIELSNEPF